MPFASLGLVIIGGLGLTMQAAVNARLRQSVGSPALSALISFIVGGIALALLALSGALGRGRLPAPESVPWWAWTGGLFGAFYVCVSVIAVPRIGTALVIAGAVLGQMLSALALDTFGGFGVSRIPLSAPRVLGAVLLLAGVALLQRK